MTGLRTRARRPVTTARWVAAAALVAGIVTAGGATATTTTVTRGAPTVVAIVEADDGGNGYNPYHFDFLAERHPWNLSADPNDDIDLSLDPSTYITGYPAGAHAVPIQTSTNPTDLVSGLVAADATAWSGFQQSTTSTVRLNWIPGTKIIGAVSFGQPFVKPTLPNDAHGTRTAASAVGNLHGTCPECLVVLVNGEDGLAWAQQQSWIDVVSNSWSLGGDPVNRSLEGDLGSSAARVDAGQTIVFAAGNGAGNANDVTQFSYASGQRGPDWVVTVGSTDRGWNFAGSGRPVDIAAQGIAYQSTGGDTVSGSGYHAGTSNAAPVVAGTFAKVIQQARDLLQDSSGGYSGGVLAAGTPVACGAAVPACPLGDGDLDRKELDEVVFRNVLPSKPVEDGGSPVPPVRSPAPPSAANILNAVPYPKIPPTRYSYFDVGHGVVAGRDNPAAMATEQARFRDVLRGDVGSLTRPSGETAWMISDSKCRQRIWGDWDGGYWTGSEPNDGSSDLATVWDAWCTPDRATWFRAFVRWAQNFYNGQRTTPPLPPTTP